jgi:hypothetical protein
MPFLSKPLHNVFTNENVFYYGISNIFIFTQNYERILPTTNYEIISNDIKFEFNKLFGRWQEETEYQSSSEMFENIYYQEIVKLGEKVVPHIINVLKSQPDYLFVALKRITNENPVKPEHRGRIKEMSRDWIEWWESK